MTDDHAYDDIIDQPHHTSRKHQRMSLHNRAAQFAPFAALSGYEEMVGETARLTDRRKGTDEENLQKLDQQIHALMEQAQDHPEITLVIFEPDEKKEGGAYRTIRGQVRRIDEVNREIVFMDRSVVRMEMIYAIVMEDMGANKEMTEEYYNHLVEADLFY